MWGVSDGSVREGNTTSGWILKSGTEDLIWGGNIVPGAHTDSTRAELAGLYSMVSMIHTICLTQDITTGKVTLGCDSDSALEKIR